MVEMDDVDDMDMKQEEFQKFYSLLSEMFGTSSTAPYDFDPLHTLIYAFLAFCLVVPPTAFVQAGITIESLFGWYLGDVGHSFCEYQVKRSFVTLIVCSFLPFGNVLVQAFSNANFEIMLPILTLQRAPLWTVYSSLSIMIALGGLSVAFWWKIDGWRAHPFSSQLKRYAARVGQSERAVSINLDTEFRSINKFAVGLPGWEIIVTESWIIRTSLLRIDLAHQADAHVELVDSQEVDVTYNTSFTRQFLTIRIRDRHVTDTQRSSFFKAFTFRLNAVDYETLRLRLSAPVDNVRDILIEANDTERFVRVFSEQIDSNPVFTLPDGTVYEDVVEQCVGCARMDSDVKLVKRCDSNATSPCRQCFCRVSMWCARCLAIWFATRQDANAQHTWLSGTAPCPTCRAPFCVLDVSRIDTSHATRPRHVEAGDDSD